MVDEIEGAFCKLSSNKWPELKVEVFKLALNGCYIPIKESYHNLITKDKNRQSSNHGWFLKSWAGRD
jgi:hypothetical protein